MKMWTDQSCYEEAVRYSVIKAVYGECSERQLLGILRVLRWPSLPHVLPELEGGMMAAEVIEDLFEVFLKYQMSRRMDGHSIFIFSSPSGEVRLTVLLLEWHLRIHYFSHKFTFLEYVQIVKLWGGLGFDCWTLLLPCCLFQIIKDLLLWRKPSAVPFSDDFTPTLKAHNSTWELYCNWK